jgi:predicted nuclease of restriction endonuclease-like (RecB) superfamily
VATPKRTKDVVGAIVKSDAGTAELLAAIRHIWESARLQAVRSVNSALVQANWLIGRQIVEAEQKGKSRAAYSSRLLKTLSETLEKDYGNGFSVSALQYMRAFYRGYPALLDIQHAAGVGSEKQHAVRVESAQGSPDAKGHALRDLSASATEADWQPGRLHVGLSWTHYRTLLKVERREARDFYEIEAIRNGWSARQLERQINTFLFDRLLKSRDKAGVLALANEGLVPARPLDAIKDPYVLEFLDLPESHRLVESRVEEALISRLQDFLLELGSGFAFIGRQVRLTLDGDHFYPDLVFYHVKLKCYVVIDLKVEKLTHGDLGQMQMYVNYYDREIAGPEDQPTVGLILCADKNEAMVRYVLDDKAKQIFASRYQFQLPSEDVLRAEIKREMEELDSGNAQS